MVFSQESLKRDADDDGNDDDDVCVPINEANSMFRSEVNAKTKYPNIVGNNTRGIVGVWGG